MTEDIGVARRIPRWAAKLLSRLTQDRPLVITRDALARYLAELGDERPVDRTINDLRRLGWLSSLRLKGVWAFVPLGEPPPNDPYLDLRAWRAREPDAQFALAGEAAAWHLGYIKRRFDGPPAIWVPATSRVPHGLRGHVSVVSIDWPDEDARRLGPSMKFLRKKGLDVTAWAGGLPAFGPDALLAQLAVRPGSFRAWADLIEQLSVLASDCDLERLTQLLRGHSASAWQRAAYFLERGERAVEGLSLLERRPNRQMPVVTIGEGPTAIWSADFRINDHLIAPLQEELGKA